MKKKKWFYSSLANLILRTKNKHRDNSEIMETLKIFVDDLVDLLHGENEEFPEEEFRAQFNEYKNGKRRNNDLEMM